MSHIFAITSILFVIFGISRYNAQDCKANENKDWCYDNNLSNGPDHWGDSYPDCKEGYQSPIDILTDDVGPIEDSEGLQLTDYDQPISKLTIENTGYNVKVTPNDDCERAVTVNGVPYNLVAFYLKWGNKTTTNEGEPCVTPGSDHEIDGKQYAMELQLEHKNEAEEKVIIAVLFDDTGDDSCPVIEAIQASIDKYKYQDDKYEGDLDEDYGDCNITLNLSDLVPSGAPYFQYNGSLPLPPCTKNVTWLVLKNPSTVATSQVLNFCELYSVNADDATDESSECRIVNNYRPTQDLNGRTVSCG